MIRKLFLVTFCVQPYKLKNVNKAFDIESKVVIDVALLPVDGTVAQKWVNI